MNCTQPRYIKEPPNVFNGTLLSDFTSSLPKVFDIEAGLAFENLLRLYLKSKERNVKKIGVELVKEQKCSNISSNSKSTTIVR